MFAGIRNVVWNIRLRGWSYVKNYAGVAVVITAAWGGAWYGIYSTKRSLNEIVVARALDRERSGAPEYLYYNDPAHEQTLLQVFQDKGWSIWPYIGKFSRRWRRAVLRRLLQVARDGDTEERMRALHHLKHFRLHKDWEVWCVAQQLDSLSAVRLARMGAGPRLLAAPPLPPALRHLPPSLPIMRLAQLHPHHHCLISYLQKHSDPHQLLDAEGGSGSSATHQAPDEEEELAEALSAALHHLSGETCREEAAVEFAREGGLSLLRRAANSSDRELQTSAARLLLCLAPYHSLLPIIHRSGLIEALSRWLEGEDGELSCLAGGALAGMEGTRWNGAGEIYGPAVQLLHPTHHTKIEPRLDVVTVHGLLGEPFVTWRQRDQEENGKNHEVIIKTGDEGTLEDDDEGCVERRFEFVFRDLPESSLRDNNEVKLSHRGEHGLDKQENTELNERTKCWPRDWLPRDCPSIRVLGVSYDTVMTEWGAGECAAETGSGLEERARMLSDALRKAGVGSRTTLWVAHSMGGLLVKQMLVHSLQSSDENEQKLAANTWGIIFYSTPHHGTRAAHALLWPSREVQDLREDSSALKRLHSVWLSGGWRCVCMAEGRPTKLVAGLPRLMLVPPASADAGVGPCYTLPLNHLDICKPATRHSFIYRQVVEMVQHALGERCRPSGCRECAHVGTKEGNFFRALYQRIFPSEVQMIAKDKEDDNTNNDVPNKNKRKFFRSQ